MKEGRNEFVMVISLRRPQVPGSRRMNYARNLSGSLDITKCFVLKLMNDFWPLG